MDKSFNDEELSDIMKEIEALEEGQKEETKDVLEDLVNLKEAQAIPLRPETKHTFPKAQAPASHTSMSFKVSGELNLELQFDVGGKIISMNVSEDGLAIVMDGGMTFTVPLQHKKSA